MGAGFLSKKGCELAMEHSDVPEFDQVLGCEVTYTRCWWGKNTVLKDWFGWDGAGGECVFVVCQARGLACLRPVKTRQQAAPTGRTEYAR